MVLDPFLSWAGGKRKLLPKLVPHIPAVEGRYFEPFLGSGSVFFALRPDSSHLSDTNESLIETFIEVRDNVDRVIDKLSRWEYSKEEYYRIRDLYRPRSLSGRAARFIFLNKTCWNGLYRENLDGRFNVPFGRRSSPDFLNRSQLRACSEALQGTTIVTADFEDAVKGAQAGDFVYFDPPYVSGHTNNGFIEYNARLFTWEDQERLATLAKDLCSRGVGVAITNGAHASIRRLYRGFRIEHIDRISTIAGDASRRRPCRELLLLGGL